MAHETPVRAHLPRQSAAARSARRPEAPTQDGRRPGAAAQLAALHRTLRHGPVLQLEAAGAGANRTGLPDRLKSGVEALSGVALDDVRVHYNSAKPAQLDALAYTRGSDIHVAPGQERHLPHEAWHVVQQAQGRVKPTLQMKGLPINDDTALEREADAAASAVFSLRADRLPGRAGVAADIGVVQMAKGKGGKNVYWFDDRDARIAYLTAVGAARFPIHTDAGSVEFVANQRVTGAQWISSDMDVGGGVIFHFTLTFAKLNLAKGNDGKFATSLRIKNLHGTVRTAVDSERVGAIIDTVAPLLDQEDSKLSKKQLELKEEYRKIQERSLHAGKKGALKPGGKADAEAARQWLGLTKEQMKTGTGPLIAQLEVKLAQDFAAALAGETVDYDGEKLGVGKVDVVFSG